MSVCRFAFITAVGFSLMLLMGVAGGGVAFAAGPAAGVPLEAFAPWTDAGTNECGMHCLYRKSNENIGLQAKFVYEKLLYLDRVDGDEQKTLDSLGTFCMPSEAAKPCKERYQKVAVLYLNKARSAMIRNSDSASKLLAARIAVGGAPVPGGEKNDAYFFTKGVDPNAPSPKPQTPYVPSYDELQRQHAQLRRYGTNEYRAWVDQLPRKPSKDDFVKFREIWRDPENPSSGKLMIIDTKPDGSPNYDEAAFARAASAYELKMKLETGDFEKMKASAPKDSQLYAEGVKFERPRPALQKPVEGSPEDLWNHSRAPLVNMANTMIRGSGMDKIPSQQVLSFAGNPKNAKKDDPSQRGPAADPNAPGKQPNAGPAKSVEQNLATSKVLKKKVVSEEEAYRLTNNGTDRVSDVKTLKEGGKNSDFFTGYSPEYFAPRYLDEFYIQ